MLTTDQRQRLRINLLDWEGNSRYAEYSDFRVDSEQNKYKLISVGTYSGNAGQCNYVMMYNRFILLFTARCYSERGLAMARRLSVCLSFRPSVTLQYRDHIGWNSWKIISRLSSLTFLRSADSNVTDVLQGEHPKF